MTDQTKDLKPCPFCGGAARHLNHSAGIKGTMGYDNWQAVACASCEACVGASSRRFRTKDEATAAWNRRASATSAPVQPLQPLSDDELDLICEKALFCKISKQQFARSIEAAHGITGNLNHLPAAGNMVGQPLTDEQIEELCWTEVDQRLLSFARAIESAVRAQGDGWLPIESAPQGRKVIVGYPNKLGKWRTVMACFYKAGTLMADDDCDNCDEDGYAHPGWYEESESHESILPTDETPTHWQPLPPPPNAQGATNVTVV